MTKKKGRHSSPELLPPDDPIYKEGLTIYTPYPARIGSQVIDPGFAMLHRGKRDSHIDPPTFSNAIMRRPASLPRREQ